MYWHIPSKFPHTRNTLAINTGWKVSILRKFLSFRRCASIYSGWKVSILSKFLYFHIVHLAWNKTRRLVWMVYDPEIANQHLQYLIEHYQYPRQFDYRMEEDIEWKQPEWYFRAVRT